VINENTLEIFNDDCFANYITLIHTATGIRIVKNRKAMLQGRIRKRVLALSLKSYEEYFDYILKHDEERIPFVDLVTTNETYFFRTPRIWNYLENQFLPNWIQQKNGKKMLAWSAASSTGEEAHSLGILCHQFKDKNSSFDYEISGSDISRRVVNICKEGHYQGRSIETFRNTMPQVFARYMINNTDEKFSVLPDIKKRISFFEHNLFTKLKNKTIFDLILVRNVFIYFSPTDQRIVLDLILPHLADDGILIIGESESLSGIDAGVEKIENLIYKKSFV
jgi:chemotaxis protein methyltransferase CheR